MRLLDWPPIWTLVFVAGAVLLGLIWSPLPGLVVPGVIVIALAIGFAAWAGFTLVRAGTPVLPGRVPEQLVVDGPFRLSRNPIYLADVVTVAGCAIAMGQPLGIVFAAPLALILERRFIAPEEVRLADRFGDEFSGYRARVRRWL